VLISESADELAEIHRAFKQETRPANVIEERYVVDYACIVFEELRLRRCMVGIINSSFRSGLRNLLAKLYSDLDLNLRLKQAEALASGWFSDKETKKEVLQILSQFHLDESAVEAAAVESCLHDIERIQLLLTSLEMRRTRALRCLAEYRASLAHQLQETTERILQPRFTPRPVTRIRPRPVARLEGASSKDSAVS
jgi:hypothetical protein